MGADAGQMLLEGDRMQVFGYGVAVVGVGVERDFGVDDEVAAAGQVDDDVRAGGFAARAVFVDGREALLEAILLAFAQTGFFEQVAKDEFAPVALCFGRAPQSRGQVVGLRRLAAD